MITLTILLIVISIFEVRSMLKNNQKKELIVYTCLALLTWVVGLIYISDPYQESIAKMLLDVFGISV